MLLRKCVQALCEMSSQRWPSWKIEELSTDRSGYTDLNLLKHFQFRTNDKIEKNEPGITIPVNYTLDQLKSLLISANIAHKTKPARLAATLCICTVSFSLQSKSKS